MKPRLRWIVVILAVLNGGWMAFDGGRALVTGNYVTPSSGEYAGQLGPWADVVEGVGLDPHAMAVKATFVVYGMVLMLLAGAFAARVAGARGGLLVAAVLGLWYLPFGTLLNGLMIVLLGIGPAEAGRSGAAAGEGHQAPE